MTFDHFIYFPGVPQYDWGGLIATQTLNSTNTKLAFRYPCPSSGVYNRIRLRVNTAASPAALRIGLQSIVSGNPDGIWRGINASGFGYLPTQAASTSYDIDLYEGVNINQGEPIVVVVEWSGSAGNIVIPRSLSHAIAPTTQTPFSTSIDYVSTKHYTTSWQTVTLGNPIVGVYKSGSSVYSAGIVIPPNSGGYTAFSTSTSPDEVGMRELCVKGTVTGFIFGGRVDDDIQFTLYDDNWMPLASSVLYNEQGWNTSYGTFLSMLSSDYAIESGWYRFTAKPLTTTSSNYERSLYPSQVSGLIPQFATMQSTSRTDEGSVVDTDFQMYSISLMYNSIDVGSAVGSGTTSPRIRIY